MPRGSISVFALTAEAGESVEELMKRLSEHVHSHMKSKWICFTTWDEIELAGFEYALSEPPRHHYDVFLDDFNDSAEAERLAMVFDRYDRRRFPSCELP